LRARLLFSAKFAYGLPAMAGAGMGADRIAMTKFYRITSASRWAIALNRRSARIDAISDPLMG
jgi:hypothetical protein